MYFDKFFKKRQAKKTNEAIQADYERQVVQFKNAANSQVFKFFKEYFEAKIEINRDAITLLDALNKKDAEKIAALNIENKMMASFIDDIEDATQLD